MYFALVFHKEAGGASLQRNRSANSSVSSSSATWGVESTSRLGAISSLRPRMGSVKVIAKLAAVLADLGRIFRGVAHEQHALFSRAWR